MSDAVQQIKDRLSILDVIAPYVELHKAGKHYKGKSPFSNERTPSFMVSPERGMYYCFSTSQGGDMFTFIETMEGVDFKEALKILAAKAGVELVPENPQAKTERERQLALIEAAVAFYVEQLAQCAEAQDYLARRKVKAETIRDWRIGYAPGPPRGGWRDLKAHLGKQGYTDDEIFKAGLIKRPEGGKEPYDTFRDRVMFPMAEQNGKVVAFSGRILAKDSDAPKYVNSPETPLYKKSELLFGYDRAKHGIRQLDFSLIVEGQFDVVMCHQAGYHNAVAVSGTALTPHHVMLLERLSSRVVLALDADRAGVSAVKRAAELMLRRGLDVKVARLPEGSDPADLAAEDVAALKRVIGKATHVVEFLLALLKDGTKDERTYKLRAREEVLPLIAAIPNKIDQEHFVKQAAAALETTEEAIRFEVARLEAKLQETRSAASAASSSRPAEPASAPVAAPAVPVPPQQVETLWHYLAVAKEVVPSELRPVIEREVAALTALGEVCANSPDARQASELTFRLEAFVTEQSPRRLREEVADKLNHLRRLHLRHLLQTARAGLIAAETAGDEAGVAAAMATIQSLQRTLAAPPLTAEIFESPRA